MPTLQAIHGRIVDLRRHINVHLVHGHRPPGPSDRYQIWIKQQDGRERRFLVNTRTMPARCGHEISLIVTTHKTPRLLALANWSTIDGVNYARSDAPSLLRPGDFVLLALAFPVAAVIWGDVGMALFLPAAVAYLVLAAIGRAIVQSRLARIVDRVIQAEAWHRPGHGRTMP